MNNGVLLYMSWSTKVHVSGGLTSQFESFHDTNKDTMIHRYDWSILKLKTRFKPT